MKLQNRQIFVLSFHTRYELPVDGMETIFRGCPKNQRDRGHQWKSCWLSFGMLCVAGNTDKYLYSSKSTALSCFSHCKKKIERKYQKERKYHRNNLIGNMLLLQKDAPPHTAGLTKATSRNCGIELLLPQPAIGLLHVSRDGHELKGKCVVGTDDISRATIERLSI